MYPIWNGRYDLTCWILPDLLDLFRPVYSDPNLFVVITIETMVMIELEEIAIMMLMVLMIMIATIPITMITIAWTMIVMNMIEIITVKRS